VAAIAPFLSYDSDPYMVVGDDGKLSWIIDAYTHTGNLPYSKPLAGGTTISATRSKWLSTPYDGSVVFYMIDLQDVLAKTYAAVFRRSSSLSLKCLQTFGARRYPRALLQIQAQMFKTFHMTDPAVFYNKEDLWEVPSYRQKTMDPYYLITKLPGHQAEEFILLLPFTPSKRDNLAAWDGGAMRR